MTKWDKYIKSITSAVERTDYLYEKWSKLHDENSYVTKIMYMIYVTGLVRQKDIVENYGMPKQTVNTVITGLLKNGYINLTPDKTDKRSKIIELTDSGLDQVELKVTHIMTVTEGIYLCSGTQLHL